MTSFPCHADYTPARGLRERYISLTAEPEESFEQEFSRLMNSYEEHSLPSACEMLLRFHLSDITRQAPLLENLLGYRRAFVSIIGQAPANGARVALEAWQIETPAALACRNTPTISSARLELDNYTLILSRSNTLSSEGSYGQTREEFDNLGDILREEGATLGGNVQRTWVYCRDIDNNYMGMVEARKEIFEKENLTHETHYITSTGIEGQSAVPGRLIAMDSLILKGTEPGQIEHMSALDHLSDTHVYGVTFERGTRIIYGDRSTYYIAGTASIDSKGEILHDGDVAEQTRRTLENIKALLGNHGGSMADLKQATVYLRDSADSEIAERIIAASDMKDVPRITVKAPVCRPGWLIEIEAIGINGNGDGRFADFH